jgi:hypothetical protein
VPSTVDVRIAQATIERGRAGRGPRGAADLSQRDQAAQPARLRDPLAGTGDRQAAARRRDQRRREAHGRRLDARRRPR